MLTPKEITPHFARKVLSLGKRFREAEHSYLMGYHQTGDLLLSLFEQIMDCASQIDFFDGYMDDLVNDAKRMAIDVIGDQLSAPSCGDIRIVDPPDWMTARPSLSHWIRSC